MLSHLVKEGTWSQWRTEKKAQWQTILLVIRSRWATWIVCPDTSWQTETFISRRRSTPAVKWATAHYRAVTTELQCLEPMRFWTLQERALLPTGWKSSLLWVQQGTLAILQAESALICKMDSIRLSTVHTLKGSSGTLRHLTRWRWMIVQAILPNKFGVLHSKNAICRPPRYEPRPTSSISSRACQWQTMKTSLISHSSRLDRLACVDLSMLAQTRLRWIKTIGHNCPISDR